MSVPRREAPIWLVVAVLGGLYASRFLSFGYERGDEGVILMSGWRTYLGEVPHRDFLDIVPPLASQVQAVSYWLLGVGFLAERVLVATYAVLLIVGCERLLHRYTTNLMARVALVSFLVPMGVLHWRLPSHHWLVAVLQIYALLFMNKALTSQRPAPWGIAAGALCGLACFTLQDQGAYLVAALLILFFTAMAGERRWRLFVAWAGGGLTIAGAYALYLIPRVGLSTLRYQWLTFPMTRYRRVAGNEGINLVNLGWQEIGAGPWLEHLWTYPDYTLPQTTFTVLLPMLPAISLLAFLVHWSSESRPSRMLLLAGTLAFIGGCLHRVAQINLIWAAPMLLIPPLAYTAALAEGRSAWARGARGMLIGVIALSVTYGIGKVRMTEAKGTVSVTGRAGTLTVPARSTQETMQLLIDAVEAHVPPDAPLFCDGYNSIIPFWTQRRNPSPFNFFAHPNYHTDEQAEEVVRSLQSHPDTHVMLFDPIRPQGPVESYVLQNYTPVWRQWFVVLYAPKSR